MLAGNQLRAWALRGTVVLILGLYGFSLRGGRGDLTSATPVTYYQLLTDALLSGQTHLKVTPSPALLALANPYGGYQGVERCHDATLYNGRYYLYFSALPVVLLLGPWTFLTGTYLADAVATVVFAAWGFLFATWLAWAVRRRVFPKLSPWADWVAAVTLGIGHFGLFVLQSPQVYPVPTLCGYACLMAAAWCTWRALESDRHTLRWLWLVGLAGGLAVASRPNYLFGLPVLLLCAWLAPRQIRRRALTAVIVPPAVIGGLLALYNTVRFGVPWEFGLRYQLGSDDLRHITLFDPANLGAGLAAYFLSPVVVSPFFPFIDLPQSMPGIVWIAPLVVVGFAAPVVWFSLRDRLPRALTASLAILWVPSVMNMIALCLYPFPVDRYAVDFVPGLTWAGLFVWACLAERSRRLSWCIVPLATITVLGCALLGLKRFESPATIAGLERVANKIVAWSESLRGVDYGAVELDVVFPDTKGGVPQPLLSVAGGRDMVIARSDGEQWRLGVFQQGLGSRESEPFAIKPGQTHRIGVTLSSLLPPASHPAFVGWPEAAVAALRRKLELTVDGRVVLASELGLPPAPPGSIELGIWPVNEPRFLPRFLGTVRLAGRSGVPPLSELSTRTLSSPLRLTVRFPPFRGVVGEPLLSTGRTGAGDLLVAFYTSPTTVRFMHDHWQAGPIESAEVTIQPERDYTLDLTWGALEGTVGQESESLLVLRLDGRTLLRSRRPFWGAAPFEVSLGYNAIASGTANPAFMGPTLRVEPSVPLPEAVTRPVGPLALTVRLPVGQSGLQQPLLVTGVTGAADFIYIVLVDDSHIRIGHDNWGGGGVLSEPIKVDYARAQAFTLTLGSLYPDITDPAWGSRPTDTRERLRQTVSVVLNGREVLRRVLPAHPATPEQIYVATNPVGGSTCIDRFLGQVLVSDFTGLPTESDTAPSRQP